MLQRNGGEEADTRKTFWFYYRPSCVVRSASVSGQNALKAQAEGSAGCYIRYPTWLLLAT